MKIFKPSQNLSIILATTIFLVYIAPLLAQDSPRDFVDAHNRARASVGVGAIRWDEKVADYARYYANERKRDCKLVHSGGPYGENLAWSSGRMSGVDAVKMWVDGKGDYYTQVVWKKSVKLGCAKVTCNNGRGTFITCNYDPPGNVRGEWPY